MKQLLLLLALPMLAFSACSKDDNDDDSTTDSGTPLIARRVYIQEPNGNSDDLQYAYDSQKRCTLINGVNVKFRYNYTGASDISVVIVPTATQDTAYRTILLKDGWASEQFYRTGNGPLAPERIYERNADHSVKRQTNYSVSNPGQISSVEEYEYDSDGNRTRALTFNKDGVLQSITTYEFDKSTTNTINGENYGLPFFNTPYKNLYLHSIEKNALGNTIEEINYTYEKDAQGRITKAIWTYVVPAGKKETNSYTYR